MRNYFFGTLLFPMTLIVIALTIMAIGVSITMDNRPHYHILTPTELLERRVDSLETEVESLRSDVDTLKGH